jgi:hypothetical protein
MTLLSFLRHADFVASVAADASVLCFAFPAYRRTKMRAFAFLIWGSVMGIVLESGLRLHKTSTGTAQDALTFLHLYRTGYFVAVVLWGIGVVQLIQYVQRELEGKTSFDEPGLTAAAPPTGEPVIPKAGDPSTLPSPPRTTP